MKKISSLASLVLKEEIRKKIIFFCIIAAFGFILLGKTFTAITPGAEKKFIIDFSYTWINIIGVLIVLITATGVISDEEKLKTDYFYRTNPVSDSELITGKFFGASGVTLLSATIMQLFYLFFFWYIFRECSFEQIKGFILMDFQLLLLVSISIFASCLFSRFSSILFCLSIYFMGLLSSFVVHLGHQHHQHQHDGLKSFADVLVSIVYRMLPNFEKFNVSEYLILEIPIKKGLFWETLGYGIITISVILGITIVLWKLRRKLQ